MPTFNLRKSDGTLHPHADYKVWAVMAYPHDKCRRLKMLAKIERYIARQARAGSLSDSLRAAPELPDFFLEELGQASSRAGIATGMLLTMIALKGAGARSTLNTAVPLVRSYLPKWHQPTGPYWSKGWHVDHSSDFLSAASKPRRSTIAESPWIA
jgi:hypothetical protein